MTSFFNTIKKLIKNEDSSDEDEYDFPRGSKKNSPNVTGHSNSSGNSQQEAMVQNIYQNGIGGSVTSIAFDSVQNLMAIGFNDGVFKVFGKCGMEQVYRASSGSSVRKIFFLQNTVNMVIVTENSLEKWNYIERKIIYCLNFKNRITAIGYIYEQPFIYIGNDTGVIQIYNVSCNFLSSYIIDLTDLVPYQSPQQQQQTPPLQSQQPQQQQIKMYPTNIKVSPEDNNFMLIGYSNGLVIIWNSQCKRVERRVEYLLDKERSYVSSLCWSRKGSKFLAGTLNGDIYLFNIQKLNEPNLIYKSEISQQQKEFTPIDQLEWLYTKDKKILLFKGTFHGSKSLVLVKGDNFKDLSKLSTISVQNNISNFSAISSLPYSNQGEFLGIVLVNQQNQVLEAQFNAKTNTFQDVKPIVELNMKSRLKEDIIEHFEIYENCSMDLLNQFNSIERSAFLVGCGNSKNNSKQTFNLMITQHPSDKSLIFWNCTDTRSIEFLYHLQPLLTSGLDGAVVIRTFSFSPSNSVLLVSLSNGSVLVYTISDISMRITSTQWKIADNIQQQTDSTQTSGDGVELPNPNFQILKYLSTLTTMNSSEITSLSMNPFQNGSVTRLLMGSSEGRIYHLMVSLVDNKKTVDAPSKIVYRLNVMVQGVSGLIKDLIAQPSLNTSSGQLQLPTNNFAIKHIIPCFQQLRESEDLSIFHISTDNQLIGVLDITNLTLIHYFQSPQPIQYMHYLTKRGNNLQYIFLNFPNLDDMSLTSSTSSNGSNDPQTQQQQQVEKKLLKCEDVNLLVSTTKDIVFYNVPLSNLLVPNIPRQSLEHKKLTKYESKSTIVNICVSKNPSISSSRQQQDNEQIIVSLELNGSIQFISTTTLERQPKLSKTLQGSIIQLPSSIPLKLIQFYSFSNGQMVISLPQHFYSCVPNAMVSIVPLFFNGDIKLSPKPQSNTITKLLFSKAPPKLEDFYHEDGTEPPLPLNSKSHASPSSSSATKDINSNVRFFADDLERIKQALNERGEKLNEMLVKTNEMSNASHNFAQMAKQLKNNM
ncbi:putative importin subunit alpha B [Tieghemostelium lacteum]|uniref:Putative importin subunit alpha B n=1 Tax=Tieghemostelium lacteum TaxID=361077 RepID=A0A152A567_TIELA|nr:putative importin subunit alpha B [Tieghemostelium lacteum]|eukprot:KYR01378.1 putative importin subunit alpha B [Tieghemostelium lacteum]